MTRYTIHASKHVKKFLDCHSDIAQRFLQKISIMSTDPFSATLDIQKLEWKDNHYRLRISKYRFLFTLQEWEILIYFYKAGKRWDVYKK